MRPRPERYLLLVALTLFSFSRLAAQDFLPAERVKEILRFGEMRYASGGPRDIGYADYLQQIHANVSHGYGGVGFGVSWGFPDRATFDKKRAELRAKVAQLHARGIMVITYISPILWYGDPQKRTKVFDFYDKRWKDYEDFLGPRPGDPMTWVQVRKDGAPLPYEYKGDKGFYWCVNNPATAQYIQGAIKMDIATGADGVFYDGPAFYSRTCYCTWCRKRFREFMGADFTASQRKDLFGTEDPDSMQPPEKASDGPLFVAWNMFRTASLVRFMRETRAFARTINPGFVLTVNYCMGGDPYGPLSSCGEDPVCYREGQDILFNETREESSPCWREGRRITNSPSFQFLAAAAKDQPVAVTNYLIEAERPEGYANLTRLAMAEALANNVHAVPWWASHPDPKAVEAYNTFIEMNREALIGSRPVSDVGLVCSLRQGYAGLRSAAMPVSRMLLDVSVHHIFLLDEDITAAALRDCRVIILPQTRMLSNPQIEALRAYFEGGGNLVVLGDCGTLDEYARRRADGLMRLVGTAATSREVFRGESGGRRMVYIPTEKLPKLPATGREEIAGDLGEIQKAVTWAAHDLLPCRNPLPCQVEVHLAKKRSGEAEVLLAHIVNYQVDLAGKVSPVDDLKIKVLVPEGCRVTGVRSLSGQQGLSAEMEAASGRSYVVVKIPRLLIYDLVEIDVIRSKKESPG